jgi:hypothetical protein
MLETGVRSGLAPLSEALKVACCARVLRIERSAGGVIGMAVQITDFDFLAST